MFDNSFDRYNDIQRRFFEALDEEDYVLAKNIVVEAYASGYQLYEELWLDEDAGGNEISRLNYVLWGVV